MRKIQRLPLAQPSKASLALQAKVHRPGRLTRSTMMTDSAVVTPAPQVISVGAIAHGHAPFIPTLATLRHNGTSPHPRQLAMLHDERRFPVTVDLSREEVRLPFGVPRYVNAATLKTMVGARSLDQLFKKVGDAWEFVDNNVMIDLTDRTEQFRVGRVTIFS
jgi:hypothetical protein